MVDAAVPGLVVLVRSRVVLAAAGRGRPIVAIVFGEVDHLVEVVDQHGRLLRTRLVLLVHGRPLRASIEVKIQTLCCILSRIGNVVLEDAILREKAEPSQEHPVLVGDQLALDDLGSAGGQQQQQQPAAQCSEDEQSSGSDHLSSPPPPTILITKELSSITKARPIESVH